MELDSPVPESSATYREFSRLYRLALSLRASAEDRWNNVLISTKADTWGGLRPSTGTMRLSEDRVLRYLTGQVSAADTVGQAQALGTVLHEATHAGMAIDAPDEPNAVLTAHSRGAIKGFAEARTVEDFDAFAGMAGYDGLVFGEPQYPGAFAAVTALMTHVTGPALNRAALIDMGVKGPGVMHLDQFAQAIVQNRLRYAVPGRWEDQVAVRAALIRAMGHDHWPTLPQVEAGTGASVTKEICKNIDAKVEEIRLFYHHNPNRPFDEPPLNPKAALRKGAAVGAERPRSQPEVEKHTSAVGRSEASSGQSVPRFVDARSASTLATKEMPLVRRDERGPPKGCRPGTQRDGRN